MNRSLLLLVCSLLFTARAGAQTVRTIQDAGPPETRLDLVLLAEGYRTADQAAFDEHAAALVKRLHETPPFGRYRAFMNVHTVFAPTPEAGIGREGKTKATLFETRFNGSLVIQGDLAKIQLAALAAPDVDKVMVLCNDSKKGGAAYGPTAIFTTAFASTGSSYLNVAVHELGHLLGNLADEYTQGRSFKTDLEDAEDLARFHAANPNVTPFTQRERIPWRAWIERDARVPGGLFTSGVSAFEGAAYRRKGMFRPRRSCKMKNNVSEFCEPCREALVSSLHAHSIPTVVSLREGSGEAIVVVDSVIPSADLGVRVEQAGARLTVTVEDETGWVRTGREVLLREFELHAPAGLPVRVEGSGHLANDAPGESAGAADALNEVSR